MRTGGDEGYNSGCRMLDAEVWREFGYV